MDAIKSVFLVMLVLGLLVCGFGQLGGYLGGRYIPDRYISSTSIVSTSSPPSSDSMWLGHAENGKELFKDTSASVKKGKDTGTYIGCLFGLVLFIIFFGLSQRE